MMLDHAVKVVGMMLSRGDKKLMKCYVRLDQTRKVHYKCCIHYKDGTGKEERISEKDKSLCYGFVDRRVP